jgi:Uma2 family endonuclease
VTGDEVLQGFAIKVATFFEEALPDPIGGPAMTDTRETLHTPELTESQDPFFYGFRDVWVEREGKRSLEQVPLTREDVLHPQMEDHVNQGNYHVELCTYLYTILKAFLEREKGMVVLYDVQVNWHNPRMRWHVPDIIVLAGVHTHPTASYSQAEHGGSPLFIIEVTSPATRSTDMPPDEGDTAGTSKFIHYATVGVPLYIIIDAARREWGEAPDLFAYALTNDGEYAALPLDARGWVWVAAVQLWLGIEGEQVAWYDAAGQRLPDYREERAARLATRQRYRQARTRTRQERARTRQARTRHLAAEHRTEEERAARLAAEHRAEQERARAEQERARAEQERARAEQLEQELRRLRGEEE